MAPRRTLRFGLWYDFCLPARGAQDPQTVYAQILDQIVRAEALGWDDVWLSEQSGAAGGGAPSAAPLAAAVAARTSRLRIGTSLLPLPLHDPVRVAEQAATLDVASNGRFELGVAAGGTAEAFERFGVPLAERGSRMDEAVPLLRRLLAGERLSMAGRHYRYRDVELQPRPVQARLPIWIGGISRRAVRRAARLADGYIATGAVAPQIEACRRELASIGRDPARFAFAAGPTWLLVARDPRRRWREAGHARLEQMARHAARLGPARSDGKPGGLGGRDVGAGSDLVVSPEQAAERIECYVRETGIDRLYGWTLPAGLPAEWSDEHLELMARMVIPAFR